jgi:hypothetical protein
MPHPSKIHQGMTRTLQRLGKHSKAGYYSVGGSYKDAKLQGEYKVETLEIEDEIRYIFWNPIEPCISAVFYKDDKIAVIDTIAYSPMCTVDGRMEKGTGTRKMIDYCIHILEEAGASTISLQDNSYVICNSVKIPLGLMYLFKYGQTWYEKHFQFKPSEKYKAKYEDVKAKLPRIDKSCDYFTEDVVDLLVDKHGLGFWYRIEWIRTTHKAGDDG